MGQDGRGGNVGELDAVFQNGDEVTLESLRAKNLAKGRFDELKILGDGELTKKLKISAHRFSAAGAGQDRKSRWPRPSCCRARSPWSKNKIAKRQGRGQPAKTGVAQADGTGELASDHASLPQADRSRCADRSQLRIRSQTKDGLSHVGKNSRHLHDSRAAEEDPASRSPCWRSIASAGGSRCRSSITSQMAHVFSQAATGLGKLFEQVAMFSASAVEPGHDLRPGHHALHLGLDYFSTPGQRLEAARALQKEGESGRKKINEYTRYATVVLCMGQSWMYLGFLDQERAGAAAVLERQRQPAASAGKWSASDHDRRHVFLMWLGEQIDEFGIGNGISLLIMAGILARMPGAG